MGDLLRRVRHLGHQRYLAEVVVAQLPRLFLAQRQDLGHDGAVVEAHGVARGLVGGARDVGVVERLAQRAAPGELHHRQVAGHLQRELVARLALVFSRGVRGQGHVGGQAFDLLGAGVVGVGVGGVQRVFAEFLLQLGLALLDGGEALLGRALQLGAREHEVAHGVAARLALLGVKRRRVYGLVLGVQALVGAQARPELGHARQGGVVGGTQLGRVGHAVQVAHRAPGAAQLLGGHVQHAGD